MMATLQVNFQKINFKLIFYLNFICLGRGPRVFRGRGGPMLGGPMGPMSGPMGPPMGGT